MRLLLALLGGALLSGCAGVFSLAPKRVGFEDKVSTRLVEKYSSTNAPTDSVSVNERNAILNDLVFIIDNHYQGWVSELHRGRANFNVATDLAIIGLGGAGGLVASASTKSILAIVSGGVGGARVSVDRHYFQQSTTSAIVSVMESERKSKLAQLRESMATLDEHDFPLSLGISMVGEYYRCGTLIGALEKISADAGNVKATAELKLRAIRPRK